MTTIKTPPEWHRQLPPDDSDLSAKWLNLAPFQLSEEQNEVNYTHFNEFNLTMVL